jgi:hypothetical protein
VEDEDVRARLVRYAQSVPVRIPPSDVVLRRGRHQRVPAAGLAFVVAAILAVVGVAMTVVVTASHSPQRLGMDPGLQRANLPVPGGAPIPLGEETTIDAAADALGYRLYRPQDPLASDDSIARVWLSRTSQQVAIEYRSGILVLAERAQFADAQQKYAAIAEENPSAYTTNIGGVPGLVLLGNQPGAGLAVDMDVQGVHVQIQSGPREVTEDQMLRLAATVPVD